MSPQTERFSGYFIAPAEMPNASDELWDGAIHRDYDSAKASIDQLLNTKWYPKEWRDTWAIYGLTKIDGGNGAS